MAIRKWMTTYRRTHGYPLNAGWGRKLPLALVCLLCASGFLRADFTTGVRIMPAVSIPLGNTLFLNGYGTAAAFDFMPVSWFGFFVQGEYVSMGMENVESLILKDGSLGAGLVWRPADRISVRGDIMAGSYSATRENVEISGISAGARMTGNYHISPALKVSVNAGVNYYAYTPEPLMTTFTVGAGLTVDLGELLAKKSRVKIEKKDQDPVFPVLYSWYDDNDFAVVKVTNTEPNSVTDVTTSFYLEQFMAQPKVCTVSTRLESGESVEVPLRAFFRESMLELTEMTEAEGKIIVEYRSLGSKRVAEIPFTIPVYNRNSMSWEDDRRAAAFVSSKDPAALWFSKYSSSIVRDRYREGINDNIQYAIGLFEALNAYGINYVVDPSSSYADNAGSGVSIDFLQFPYQTLMYRGGDCDDLSILFCSLLEASGIESAFITIPGHIFMAFDSGLSEEEAKANFYDPSALAYKDGRAWVPVEITLTKEGFNKAWKVGAKEWNDASANGEANLFPMQESWKIYRPVSVPGAASRFSLPDQEKTVRLFDGSLDKYVAREIKPQVLEYEAMLAKNDTAETRNLLGVLYGRYGMLDAAWKQFKIAADRGYAHAVVNLGNVAFLDQDFEGSLGYYRSALERDRDDSLALLGAARCYYELDQFMNSDSLYAELGTRDATLGRRYSYLGSFLDNEGRAWSLSERLHTTNWSLPESLDPVAQASARKQAAAEADAQKSLSPRSGLVASTSLVITSDKGDVEYLALPTSAPVASRKKKERLVRGNDGSPILPPAEGIALETGKEGMRESAGAKDGNEGGPKVSGTASGADTAAGQTDNKTNIASATETVPADGKVASGGKRIAFMLALAALLASAALALSRKYRSGKSGKERRK